MLLSLEGSESTGKSTLAYTAPLPIISFSLDLGHSRALYGTQFEKHFQNLSIEVVEYKKGVEAPRIEGKDILVYELPSPIQLDPDRLVGYMELWAYFIPVYVEAIQKKGGTIIIDTMTLLTRYKREAYLQELQEKSTGRPRKQLMQLEYGHPDSAIRSLYTFAQSTKHNLVVVHHLRDHYVSQVGRDGAVESVPDGTEEIDGIRDTFRYVDVALRNEKDKKGNLQSLFMKCGPNLAFEGTRVPNLTWNGLVDMLSLNWHGEPYERRAGIEKETVESGSKS